MMNGKQYRESLQKLHPVVWCNGRQITDVTTDRMTAPHVNAAALTYDLANDPEYQDLMLVKSHFTGETINRFTHVHQSTDDLIKKVLMLRMIAQKTGTCFQRCVGFDAMNATFITTYKVDKKHGTNYHERICNFIKMVQKEDLMVDGAMTDPKGDRGKSPSGQADPDLFCHVVERTPEGVYISGAKAHQTGMVNSHYMLILPTCNMKEEDKDYAIAAAIPVDAPGVTHIFTRQTNENRRMEGDIDTGNARYAIVGGEALTILDRVFVPNEFVFMDGEYDLAQEFVVTFASYHRQNYGGCKAGVADVMIGASALIADYNGCGKAGHIKDKLVDCIHLVETMHCCSLACSAMGTKTEAGSYYVNELFANAAKLNCTRVMYEVSRTAHDIAGGFIATLPFENDFKSEQFGPVIKKYFAGDAQYPTEYRFRIARLIENMTGGTALVESMHGAGSPMAMGVMYRKFANFEQKKALAKHLAGIEE